ncbi:hypothetical protein [Alteromonas sp. 14N.309.X.WAT.G.H12]|uniref:hypothetical protein n=1 Tax=Alteromonas sp. 14N.309.X.WAT.G.H12 TaxID=3120824 RepID=UPI002FD6D3FF
MSAVESLIKNERYLGALSFLLKPKFLEDFPDALNYCCLLIEATNARKSCSMLFDSILLEKIYSCFSEALNRFSNQDVYKFLKLIDDKNIFALAKPFLVKTDFRLEVIDSISDYEYALSTIAFNITVDDQKLESLTIDQLRKLGEIAEQYLDYDKALLYGNMALKNAHHPFWDFHFVALQYSRLGNIEKSFEIYKEFLYVAIEKGNENAIKTGYIRYLECCQQLSIDIEEIQKVEERIPLHIAQIQEVKATKQEFLDIIDFKKYLNDTKNKYDRKVGFRPLHSVSKIFDEINRLTKEVKIRPNYEAFYELYKYFSVVGDIANAKKYLQLAEDFNYFLFRKYKL